MSASEAQTLAALEQAIATAQAMVARLKAPQLTPEGWAATRSNGTPPTPEMVDRFSARHGCAWNRKEQVDLVSKWLDFTSIETLARIHKRTEGGVRSELQRLLVHANRTVLLEEICGTE